MSTLFILPAAVVGLAVALGLIQFRDARRRRDSPDWLVEDEAGWRYYAAQDRRRAWGILTLFALGIAMAFGLSLDPTLPNRRHEAPAFAATWLVALGLVALLVVLALIDWVANARYARRRLQELLGNGVSSSASLPLGRRTCLDLECNCQTAGH